MSRMNEEELEKFAELFPIVLKRVLPLGIAVLIIIFLLIVAFVPNSEKVCAFFIVATFGVAITFGILAKRYAEKLQNLKRN